MFVSGPICLATLIPCMWASAWANKSGRMWPLASEWSRRILSKTRSLCSSSWKPPAGVSSGGVEVGGFCGFGVWVVAGFCANASPHKSNAKMGRNKFSFLVNLTVVALPLQTPVLIWNFHVACPAIGEYTPECPARHLFRIRSNGGNLVVPAGPLPRPKSHDLA
jgi:hypothetical protein